MTKTSLNLRLVHLFDPHRMFYFLTALLLSFARGHFRMDQSESSGQKTLYSRDEPNRGAEKERDARDGEGN